MNGTTGEIIAATPAASSPDGRAWMMVFRAFLAQNVAVGSAFGGFGVSVLSLQELHGASRGETALALSLSVLGMGLVSPFVAALIARLGLRWTMTIGALISGCGYGLLAIAPNMQVVLLLYAVPIGAGLSMFGPFPASVLASNWFRHNPGLALGIANMPLFVALMPMAGLIIIRDQGLPAFYLTLAALHLALLPLMIGVSDAATHGVEHTEGSPRSDSGVMRSIRSVLSSPSFWVMSLFAGYLNAVGITGVSHLAAFAAERGVGAEEAAGLLSILGGAAIIGSIAVGILSNRLGAPATLALIGAGMAISWFVLLSTLSFPIMALAALTLGAGGAGIFPAVSMLSGRLFGQQSLPRIIGLYSPVTLPLTFFLPPLAGVLRDEMRSYTPVAVIIIGGCAIVTMVFLAMARRLADRPAQSAEA
ncbi:MFS transporter [Sphingobium agri]|uniref:MFS transporter n=1 Tax=Sphingobium agri TaxID=2933566 RepID=A0ABT0DUW7_9SPHN|nr:MFS transporter [Sphingobium agri]MCK0530854.1 MFS transporter [Sphingobium agri]